MLLVVEPAVSKIVTKVVVVFVAFDVLTVVSVDLEVAKFVSLDVLNTVVVPYDDAYNVS